MVTGGIWRDPGVFKMDDKAMNLYGKYAHKSLNAVKFVKMFNGRFHKPDPLNHNYKVLIIVITNQFDLNILLIFTSDTSSDYKCTL